MEKVRQIHVLLLLTLSIAIMNIPLLFLTLLICTVHNSHFQKISFPSLHSRTNPHYMWLLNLCEVTTKDDGRSCEMVQNVPVHTMGLDVQAPVGFNESDSRSEMK